MPNKIIFLQINAKFSIYYERDCGMTTHMCPINAVEKIPNLVTVNESGCTTGDTLFAAYKELNKTIT